MKGRRFLFVYEVFVFERLINEKHSWRNYTVVALAEKNQANLTKLAWPFPLWN